MDSPDQGLFLVFEGVEGAGKTTQARLLARWLEEEGLPVTLAREPGGTDVGEAVRRVVLDRGDLTMPPQTELFLILAARAAFVREVVQPTLNRGGIVLADRFDLSTFAYQGHGRGLDLDQIRAANAMATDGLVPDLYLVLDLPVREGMARKEGGDADRIEREGEPFLARVAEGYRALALEGGLPVRLVDAGGSAREVQGAVRSVLGDLFPETFSFTGV